MNCLRISVLQSQMSDLIKQNAIIFGKSGENLTEWQQKVNEAAITYQPCHTRQFFATSKGKTV